MPYDSLNLPRRSRSNVPDQAQSVAYFVTLIVRERACILAEILEDEVRLTETGQIVQDEWFKAGLSQPLLKLDESEFLVMPNHIHGLVRVILEEPATNAQSYPFRRPPNILPGFMRAFKAAINQRLNTSSKTPSSSFWERGYDEQLIRSEAILRRTCHRIQLNPYRWTTDPLHPDFPSSPTLNPL